MLDIKSRRKALGLSLEQIAEKIGVNKSTVMRWESGKGAVRADKAMKLSQILQIPVHLLLSEESCDTDSGKTQKAYDYGFLRVEGAVIETEVGGVSHNAAEMIKYIKNSDSDVIVFPELSTTGYTCADLFFQNSLIEESNKAVAEITHFSKKSHSLIFIGAPVLVCGQLYNCAVVIGGGEILGIVPKTFLPNYGEYYERRWFSSSQDASAEYVTASQVGFFDDDKMIPFGRNLIFNINNKYNIAAELCEDLWTPLPPSTYLALGGAEIIVNLSASNETIGKRKYRETLISQQSARCFCGYVYVSAGADESTTDLIFSGSTVFAENGLILAKNSELADSDYSLKCDFDLQKIRADRVKNKSFKDSSAVFGKNEPCRTVFIKNEALLPVSDGALYAVEKLPFVPSAKKDRLERCRDIFRMQVCGLKKRIKITGGRPVIGISGGLDSTLALLVAAEAERQLGKSPKQVVGITMPGFGTTDRTHKNSVLLMQTLGITSCEISIKDACIQHFHDIGHDINTLDLTYENSQARERTQILMDYAGKNGGFVVGTGDLSELALGWCTYNADQMSMYGVNSSIPKTLVRWLIDSIIEYDVFPKSTEVLKDILDTPISPELLPPDENGRISQKTESLIGPYALHDFFLYYVMRYGFEPEKIYLLAQRAFSKEFDGQTIKKWLVSFYRRFFSQQFKRSCMPDGVKVGSISLSPRGDWRMPSDASARDWILRAENL